MEETPLGTPFRRTPQGHGHPLQKRPASPLILG